MINCKYFFIVSLILCPGQIKIIHNFILKSRTDIAYVGYIHVYVNICKLYKKKYMLKSLKETFQIVYSGLLNCSITSFWYLLKG